MSRPSRRKVYLQKRITKINIQRGKKYRKLKAKLKPLDTTISPTNYDTVHKLKKTRKFYKVPKGYELQAIIVSLFNNSRLLMTCTHLLIGSSLVKRLLGCNLTTHRTHGFLRSQVNRQFGKHAENCASKKFGKKVLGGMVSTKIPFLCTTPDFLLSDRVIEVKSFDKKKSYSTDMLLQLLISMEIYGKSYGELHMYTTIVNKTHAQCTLYKVIGIYKTVSLFDETFINHVCVGYLSYLSILFNYLNIDLSLESYNAALDYLRKECCKRENNKTQTPLMVNTSFCQQSLAYALTPSRLPGIPPKRSTFLWEDCSNRHHPTEEAKKKHRQDRDNSITFSKNVKNIPVPYDSDIYNHYIRDKDSTTITESAYNKNRFKHDNLRKGIVGPTGMSYKLEKRMESNKPVVELADINLQYTGLIIDSEEINRLFTRYTLCYTVGKPYPDFVFHNH